MFARQASDITMGPATKAEFPWDSNTNEPLLSLIDYIPVNHRPHNFCVADRFRRNGQHITIENNQVSLLADLERTDFLVAKNSTRCMECISLQHVATR